MSDLRLLYQIIYYGQIVGDSTVIKNAMNIGTKLKLKYFQYFEAGKFTLPAQLVYRPEFVIIDKLLNY